MWYVLKPVVGFLFVFLYEAVSQVLGKMSASPVFWNVLHNWYVGLAVSGEIVFYSKVWQYTEIFYAILPLTIIMDMHDAFLGVPDLHSIKKLDF